MTGSLSDSWLRTVTEPFRVANYDFSIGDEFEFIGQLDSRPGEVLIGICGCLVAVWASAADVAKKSSGRGKYAKAVNITIS